MGKDEAIKLALDALHLWHWTGETTNLDKAHDALREVIGIAEKPWIGLSNEDIDELIPRTDLSGDYGYQDMYAVARIVEYRLRMQNHG